MKIHQLHPWNISPAEAESIQKCLRAWIVTDDQFTHIQYVARAQVEINLDQDYSTAHITLLRLPDHRVIERHSATEKLTFPNQNGLISFRKAPVLLKALASLKVNPDLILCDGRGLIPPDRFGLASHIGLLTNTPSIGIRSIPHMPVHHKLSRKRGTWIPLKTHQQAHSAILRLHEDYPPVYISVGHRLNLETALKYTLLTLPRDLNDPKLFSLVSPEPFEEQANEVSSKLKPVITHINNEQHLTII
ncbi:endonuclease V [Endozoicomonas sp. SM1973]|uniref:Endonuclease V n=1 Tax=Spartinivicinus marinus TaxID=2994442 RepID=A0A853IDW0_9GAMM|nr:endonuclease V [Spartinivicinus marinus]MCX4025005.1 endonuclease V [Spartinivicinus marinus]NYZ67697.1 endonuclease V [Spartinivicinus marinus]